MSNIFCTNQSALRQVSIVDMENLTEAYVGTLRAKFIWINNESGADDNLTVIIPETNPSSGRWISPLAPSIPSQIVQWANVDKTGSSVDDLTVRSISDLTSGTVRPTLLPDGVPYFSSPPPSLILTTDAFGQYQLSTIPQTLVTGLIPFSKIDWTGIAPSYVGAESTLYFDPNQFDRDAFNHVSIQVMSASQAGLATPGLGVYTDERGSINVKYGTGPNQALEGTTPMLGDVSGEFSANTVDALRNIPLTFFFNELQGKDGYALTLNCENHSTPYFYLARTLPDPTDHAGNVLYTDGSSWFPKKITQDDIGLPRAITSFYTPITLLEVGDAIVPAFTASYTIVPPSVTLTDNLYNVAITLANINSFQSIYSFDRASSNHIDFTLTAQYSTPLTASLLITWGERLYYGHRTSFTTVGSLQSNKLTTSPQGSYTIDAALGEFIYVAIPVDFVTPIFSVNGFQGGFSPISTVSHVNAFGITVHYDIYRSDYPSLGNTVLQLL